MLRQNMFKFNTFNFNYSENFVQFIAVIVALSYFTNFHVSGCTNGEKELIVGNCHNYLECENEEWTTKHCDYPSMAFDPETKVCRHTSLKNCQNAHKGCSKPGDIMEVPGDCRSYYKCLENGHLVKETCNFYQLFDFKSKTCQWYFKVSCSDHPQCSNKLKFPVEGNNKIYQMCEGGNILTKFCDIGKVYDPSKTDCVISSSISQFKEECIEGSSDVIAGSCNSYYRCVRGKRQVEKCSWFQRFDPETLSCDYFWNVNCAEGKQCKLGDSAPSSNCSEYYGCEKGYWSKKNCGTELDLQLQFDFHSRECLMYGAVCFKGECAVDGMKEEFPGDCSKYRICRQGQLYEESCGWLQKFDSEKRECKYFGSNCSPNPQRPQCLNGFREVVDGSCYAYKECVGGQLKTKYCLYPFYRFHKETLTCNFMIDCNKICYNDETRPVPGRCDQYYKCINENYMLRNCSNGNFYDTVTSFCVEASKATCDPQSMNN